MPLLISRTNDVITVQSNPDAVLLVLGGERREETKENWIWFRNWWDEILGTIELNSIFFFCPKNAFQYYNTKISFGVFHRISKKIVWNRDDVSVIYTNIYIYIYIYVYIYRESDIWIFLFKTRRRMKDQEDEAIEKYNKIYFRLISTSTITCIE
jgi:hypothetical protein